MLTWSEYLWLCSTTSCNSLGPWWYRLSWKINNFKDMYAYFPPQDSVLKKRNKTIRNNYLISSVHSDKKSGKERGGKLWSRLGIETGFPLRSHTKDQHNKLTKYQKNELLEYYDSLEDKGKGRKLSGNSNKIDDGGNFLINNWSSCQCIEGSW